MYMVRHVWNCARGMAPGCLDDVKAVNSMFASNGNTSGRIYVDYANRMDTVVWELEVGRLHSQTFQYGKCMKIVILITIIDGDGEVFSLAGKWVTTEDFFKGPIFPAMVPQVLQLPLECLGGDGQAVFGF